MSHDELDELFGEIEDEEVVEDSLVVAGANEKSEASASDDFSGSEGENGVENLAVNELKLPSIKRPSSEGLIVKIFNYCFLC